MIVAPYLFLDLQSTLTGINMENRSEHLGVEGAGLTSHLSRYLTSAFPEMLGPIATALGLTGLTVMLAMRRPRIPATTFWALLVFLSTRGLWWLRWALPLAPLLAAGAAFIIDRTEARLREWRPGRWVLVPRIAVACVLVLPQMGPTTTSVLDHAGNDDTRIRAIEWIHEHVPDGSTILIDSYTTQLSSERYDVMVAKACELVRWKDVSPKLRPDGYFDVMAGQWCESPEELLDAVLANGVDYIVLADLWIEHVRNLGEEYAMLPPRYEALLDTFRVAEVSDHEDAALGWKLTILKVEDDRTDRPG